MVSIIYTRGMYDLISYHSLSYLFIFTVVASHPRDAPPVGIPKEVIPAMRKAFSNLCTSPSGVLFENSLLQVGVKHVESQSFLETWVLIY
jgi:hypothetical protein